MTIQKVIIIIKYPPQRGMILILKKYDFTQDSKLGMIRDNFRISLKFLKDYIRRLPI